MPGDDPHRLGYRRVDEDPNAPVLLGAMDATSGWAATRRLRTWERDALRLTNGQRLLDVGCGTGDAALALAYDLGAAGEVVGIDVSSEMIRAARTRATGTPCRTRFDVGDAARLTEPAASFDAVRSERTLQWLPDPAGAVAEMARVVRPGGLVSLIDTDWSTFTIDVGDDDLSARVRAAMATERGRPSNVGRRLAELARAAGLSPIASTVATHTWDRWDPRAAPAPDGCFSMPSLADDLVERGQLAAPDRDRFVATVHRAAIEGRCSMSLTMHATVAARAVSGRRPPAGSARSSSRPGRAPRAG